MPWCASKVVAVDFKLHLLTKLSGECRWAPARKRSAIFVVCRSSKNRVGVLPCSCKSTVGNADQGCLVLSFRSTEHMFLFLLLGNCQYLRAFYQAVNIQMQLYVTLSYLLFSTFVMLFTDASCALLMYTSRFPTVPFTSLSSCQACRATRTMHPQSYEQKRHVCDPP